MTGFTVETSGTGSDFTAWVRDSEGKIVATGAAFRSRSKARAWANRRAKELASGAPQPGPDEIDPTDRGRVLYPGDSIREQHMRGEKDVT